MNFCLIPTSRSSLHQAINIKLCTSWFLGDHIHLLSCPCNQGIFITLIFLPLPIFLYTIRNNNFNWRPNGRLNIPLIKLHIFLQYIIYTLKKTTTHSLLFFSTVNNSFFFLKDKFVKTILIWYYNQLS
jgi:hypothetical protein